MSPWRHSLKCAGQSFQRARGRSKQPIAGCSSFLTSFPVDTRHDEAQRSTHGVDRCHGLWTGSIPNRDEEGIQGGGFFPPRRYLSANGHPMRFAHFAAHPAHVLPPSTTGLQSRALRNFSSAGKSFAITGVVPTSHCEDSSSSTGPAPAASGSPDELSSLSGASVLSDGGVSEIAVATAECSAPIAIVQQLIDQLHVASGWPW